MQFANAVIPEMLAGQVDRVHFVAQHQHFSATARVSELLHDSGLCMMFLPPDPPISHGIPRIRPHNGA